MMLSTRRMLLNTALRFNCVYSKELNHQAADLIDELYWEMLQARCERDAAEWISVEEGLPEAHDDGSVDAVLVTDGSFTHMAYCNRGTWHFCESGEMKEPMFYKVTHWMPLPEPPEEENNG